MHILTFFSVYVEIRTVTDMNLLKFDIVWVLEQKQLGSSKWILFCNFSNPPQVALSIDRSFASEHHVLALKEKDEWSYIIIDRLSKQVC